MKLLLAPFTISACLGLGWVVFVDSQDRQQRSARDKSTEVVSVQVTRVKTRTIEDYIDLVGSLEPVSEVEIRSRTSGYITKLPFDLGDAVERDAIVVELDDSKNQEMVSSAEAALAVAVAQLKAQVAKRDFAEKEVERQNELAKSGVSTQQQREQAKSQLEIAKAELELEQARVDQAKSELENSKLSLKETRIAAPLSGFVAERFVEVGDLAQSDIPLCRIVDLATVRTAVHVVEKEYPKIKAAQRATVQVDAYPGRAFVGTVVRKSPVLDQDTRTATVRIDIPNPDGLLKPGMHARVRIVFERRERVEVVPVASLLENNETPTVFVVAGEPPTARLQKVTVGVNDGTVVEILSGVSGDDLVVTLGSRLIRDGQAVTPVELSSRSDGRDPELDRGGTATGD